MSKPELSIVVPVYNVDPWLNECLNSIQRQTFHDWKCILVDDGSTDFSGIICDSYAKKDPRFQVIHQSNAGVSAARNAGIEQADTPLLAFIDPDDFVSANYFEAQILEMRRNDAEISVSSTKAVEEDGKEGGNFLGNHQERIRRTEYKKMSGNGVVIDALCKNVFSCVSWGKVYKRSLWGDAVFPVGIDLGEDMMTIPRVIIAANSAVYSESATYFWRQRKKSLLHGTVSYDRFVKDVWASTQMLKQLCRFAPNRKEDFEKLKYQYDIGCMEAYFQSNPEANKEGSILYILKNTQNAADRI